MYNNVYSVKDIIANTDYLLFKAHVEPVWESDENADGGKWVVTIPIEDELDDELEQSWILLLSTLIGCNLDQKLYENINGIVYAVRDKYT